MPGKPGTGKTSTQNIDPKTTPVGNINNNPINVGAGVIGTIIGNLGLPIGTPGLSSALNNSNTQAAPTPNNTSNATTGLFAGLDVHHVIYWAVGGLALFALASPYPDLATGFVVLLIMGVVLVNYKAYLSILSAVAP